MSSIPPTVGWQAESQLLQQYRLYGVTSLDHVLTSLEPVMMSSLVVCLLWLTLAVVQQHQLSYVALSNTIYR